MCFSEPASPKEGRRNRLPHLVAHALVGQAVSPAWSVSDKKITIMLSEEAARWARRKAVEGHTSVSKLVGEMLEKQMRTDDK
jgi:hypothetical protein